LAAINACLFRLFTSLFMLGLLTACSDTPDTSVSAADNTPAPTAEVGVFPSDTPAELSPERMVQWSRNCALCHVRGEGGAPVLGDRAAWKVRWKKGEAELLRNTVEGVNNMPPLGYCMDCRREDFLALIRFMGGER